MSEGPLRLAIEQLARAAGDAILAVYRREFAVAYKDDASPLTEADLAAHRCIVAGLAALTPDWPVLSEESADTITASERRRWSRYWLVDPLDGTREFVKRNDEFTVNIALIDAGEPVLGVVFAPALDEMASAAVGEGAWLTCNGQITPLRTRALPATPVVAISRSHLDAGTRALLAGIGVHDTLAAGSALKFIRLAQGAADLYPRLGPTSEWDTAAGQCVLEQAGGALLHLHGAPFRYNQGESLLNSSFLAVADAAARWPQRLAAFVPTSERS